METQVLYITIVGQDLFDYVLEVVSGIKPVIEVNRSMFGNMKTLTIMLDEIDRDELIFLRKAIAQELSYEASRVKVWWANGDWNYILVTRPRI